MSGPDPDRGGALRRLGAALRARWARVLARMEPVVFFGSAATVVGFVALGALYGELATEVFEGAQRAIVERVGWFYVLTASALLVFALWIGLGRFGAIRLGGVFFVTSSDSGSLVDDMVTSGGHPDPPRAQRVFWACAEGAVAATLLVAGGLVALRTASLLTGLPLALLLWVASIGLVRALRAERREEES